MRIGTAQFHQQAIASIGQRNSSLAELQQQISSGKRINQASDDPVGAAEAERIRSSKTGMAIEQRMMSFATSMLSQAESALSAGGDTLQSARELIISAGNATFQAGDRAQLATQLQGLRDELLSVANQRDGAGGYVFGGQGSTSAPFTTAGTPTYQPLAGTQQTGTDMSFDTTVDGARVFIGNGGVTTGSIFTALDSFIVQLQDPAIDPATLSAGINSALDATDQTLGRLLIARTDAGEQLRALESRGRLIESGQLQAQSRLSDLTDTDMAAAVSDMKVEELAINAAMRTYAQISRLSLFDYL